jgi:DNA-binding MarR family transcriptional regulator
VARIRVARHAQAARRRRHLRDCRAREVAIIPKGRRLLEQCRRMARQVEDEALSGLTADERRQLLTLLRRALDSAPSQSPWRAEEGD